MATAHLITVSLRRKDGTGDYLLSQASMLRRAGYDVYLYAGWADQNVGEPVLQYLDLSKNCREDHLIIYHYGIWDPNFEIVAKQNAMRKIFYYHNQTPPILLGHDRETQLNVIRGLSQISEAEGKFSKFIANSPYTIRQQIVRGGLAKIKWSWMPPIIKKNIFFNGVNDTLEREYDFAYVGRFVPHKQLEKSIKVFAEYKKLKKTAKMVVIGGGAGTYFDRCLNLARGVGGIDFRIDVTDDEKSEILQRCISLLNLSLHEGFSIPIIEATNFGCLPFYGESEWLDMMIAEPSLRLAIDGDYEFAAYKAKIAIENSFGIMERVFVRMTKYSALMDEEYQFLQLISDKDEWSDSFRFIGSMFSELNLAGELKFDS